MFGDFVSRSVAPARIARSCSHLEAAALTLDTKYESAGAALLRPSARVFTLLPQLSLAVAQKHTGKSSSAANFDCAAEVISAAGPHETSVRATPGLRWRFQ